jgi:hypothetical protein
VNIIETGAERELDYYRRKPSEMTAALIRTQHEQLAEIIGLDPRHSWQDDALCPQTDPNAFFPDKGESTTPAKQICLHCQVRQQCLDYAVAHDERFGVWGGFSERERRRMKRGEDLTPTLRHGGHQPSEACYLRGASPGCRKAAGVA